jgi:protein-S-isoprenylcysteine O-methyltransferase Ste14
MTMSTPAQASPPTDSAAVIAPPPVIYLAALGVGFGLDAVLPSASLPSAVSWTAGVALLVAGGVLARSFFRALVRAGTTVSPYRPNTALVTDGPYGRTRNPGYLGMALAYAGIALVADAPWVLVPLPVAIALIDRGVIAREERYLARKFGAPYVEYKRRVRRWL